MWPRWFHPPLNVLTPRLEPLRPSRRGGWRFKSSWDVHPSLTAWSWRWKHYVPAKCWLLTADGLSHLTTLRSSSSHLLPNLQIGHYQRGTNIKTTYATLVSSIRFASQSHRNLPYFGTPTDLRDFYNHNISGTYFYTRSNYLPEKLYSQTLVI